LGFNGQGSADSTVSYLSACDRKEKSGILVRACAERWRWSYRAGREPQGEMSRPLLGGALIIIFAIGLLTYDSYLGLFHGPYIGHIFQLCLNLSICQFFCSPSLPLSCDLNCTCGNSPSEPLAHPLDADLDPMPVLCAYPVCLKLDVGILSVQQSPAGR